MDTSQQYIEMCKCAQELQKKKTVDWLGLPSKQFEHGDWMSYGNESYVMGDIKNAPSIAIWLPRQDQLAEMIESWNHKYGFAFFENIVANSEYRDINKRAEQSIEQILLKFLMADKYSKLWSINCWVNKS